MTPDDFGVTFSSVAPTGMRPFSGYDNAWQVARVTGTAAHFEHALLTKLEVTYALQDTLNGYSFNSISPTSRSAKTHWKKSTRPRS